MSSQNIDVVQTVVRYQAEDSYRYLIGLRSRDRYWEFLGGKLEYGETVKDAGIRELNEETELGISEEDFQSYRKGESYRSSDDRKYRLNPVLIEISPKKAKEVTQDGLSSEHLDYEWIQIEDFFDYETLGQYRALESLELVKGDVALAVAREDGDYLVVKRSESTSSSGKWNFPGGKIEYSEERREAVKRELREETSLNGEVIESGEPYINGGELGHWRIFPFLVKVSREVELNGEHSDYRWMKPEEIEELETLGTFRGMENLGEVNWPE